MMMYILNMMRSRTRVEMQWFYEWSLTGETKVLRNYPCQTILDRLEFSNGFPGGFMKQDIAVIKYSI